MEHLRISERQLINILTFSIVLTFLKYTALVHSIDIIFSLIGVLQLTVLIMLVIVYLKFHRWNQKNIIWLAVMLILAACYRAALAREILALFIYSSIIKEVNREEFIDRIIKILSTGCIIVIGMSSFNVLPGGITLLRDEVERYSLGFNHPNTCSYLLLTLSNALFIKTYNRPRRCVMLVYLLAILLMGTRTRSRMCLALTALLTIIYILRYINFKKYKFRSLNKVVRVLIAILALTGIPLSLYLANNYTVNIVVKIDSILHDRFYNAKVFLCRYPITLFGNRNLPDFTPNVMGWGAVYLDNGYIALLLKYGILSSIYFLGLLARKLVDAIKYRKFEILYPLLTIVISLYMERSCIEWLFAFPMLIKSKEDNL